jgi:hypothetical protein
MLSVAKISDLYLMIVTFIIESEHVAKIILSCHESVYHEVDIMSSFCSSEL